MAKKKAREVIIRIENVEKSFPIGEENLSEGLRVRKPESSGARAADASRRKVLEVLQGIAFDITLGEIIAIVGASGAGKSTLLHILGTLDRPTRGRVLYEGEDVFSLDDEDLARFRNEHIGFVFQFHHLLPEFTSLENVAMPALIGGKGFSGAISRAREVLEVVGLTDRQGFKPAQLSGGEQQRVAVARALMNSPRVILADEPTGNLDTANAAILHDLITRLSRERDQTFVVVTHNENLAKQADRVIRIVDGKVGPGRGARSSDISSMAVVRS
jgi:lipoprotein-releasing system ATP-binding protein